MTIRYIQEISIPELAALEKVNKTGLKRELQTKI